MNSLLRQALAVSVAISLAACGGANNSDLLLPVGASPVEDTTPETPLVPTPGPTPAGPAPAAPTPSVAGVEKATLVAPTSNGDLVPLLELVDGAIIDLNEINAVELNVVAEPDDEGSVGSVGFRLTGPVTIDRFENFAPYTLERDVTNFAKGEGGLTSGSYRLEITTYELAGRLGEVGEREIISFQVLDTEEPPEEQEPTVADVEGIELVVPNSDDIYTTYASLNDGDVLDASTLRSLSFNIVGVPSGDGSAGSVTLSLSGPDDFVAVNRIDNQAPFSITNFTQEFEFGSSDFPVGSYSLTVETHELPDGLGVSGDQQTIEFEVIAGSVVDETVPEILQISLIERLEGGRMVSLGQIDFGDEVELSGYASSNLNITATSANESRTGSVKFDLVGPISESRTETNPPYTLINEVESWAPEDRASLVGSYTLTVTPYELPAAEGRSGVPYVINFSFVDSGEPEGPPEEPPEEPIEPETDLDLASDFYVVAAGQALNGRSVADNDSVGSAAIYTLVDQPANGAVFMGVDGEFSYTPVDDFTGTDSFKYSVSQEGAVALADVTIRVVDQSSSSGFTGIVPSADSKIIYASNSTGSDSNDCLSEQRPCKTIEAALSKGREGFPDHILLKRGDTWRAPADRFFWLDRQLFSGRSASEPAVLGYYGSEGARPRIEKAGGAFHRGDKYILRNFHFIGIEWAAYKLELDHPEFTGIYKDGVGFDIVGGSENVVIEDCKFVHSEISVQQYDSDKDGQDDNSKNLVIRRNIFTGNYGNETSFTRGQRPSNMFIAHTDGLLIEENVIDYGGWNPNVPGAGASQLNHNIYLQYGQNSRNLIVRNNIIVRGASHGLQARAGGLIQDNFFARNSIGFTLGYQGSTLPSGAKARAERNVVSEGWSMARVDGGCAIVGICTRALWGIQYENQSRTGFDQFESVDNIVAGLLDDDTYLQVFERLTLGATFSITKITPGVDVNNIEFNWAFNNNPENPNGYVDPGRTLADYNESIGGSDSFDAFMNAAKERPLQTWDSAYTAVEINRYIRAGFQIR